MTFDRSCPRDLAGRRGGVLAGWGGSPLPEDDVTAVHAWCDARVPAHARDQVLVECEVTDRHLTIVERRVPY